MANIQNQRVTAVRRVLGSKGWDALVVTHMPNVYYLTGFCGSAGVALVEESRTTLFVDGRYRVQAREQAVGCRIQDTKGAPLDGVSESLRVRRGMIVALEAQYLTISQRRLLGRGTGGGAVVRWVPSSGVVEALRSRKDGTEIRAMRSTAALGCRILREVLPMVRPGVREVEIAAEIEYRMKRAGASGAAFETIVASGPRSALPHARPTSRKVGKNELVVLDMGAILGHYCCDLTRTVYLGRPSRQAAEWHSAVRKAHAAAAAALQPGITAGQVDEVARGVLKKHSVEKLFIHSTGHGLGLEVHEEPRLARGSKTVLEAGNVVTIEPGVYQEGYGGIRIEDDYLITGRGAERLTRTCTDLFAN